MVYKASKKLNKENKPTFNLKASLKKLKALVWMQLKDKLDFSWAKTKKGIIQKIILSILMFAVVTTISTLILHFSVTLGVFWFSDIIKVAILFLTLMLLFSSVSCAIGLMRNLFIAEDNKVLTTFPVTGGMLFFSKLIVYYIYEVKKSLMFMIPVLLGFFIEARNVGKLELGSIFFSLIPMLLVVSLPVLVGAIFSIPCLYINRLFKKVPIVEFIVILLVVGAGIYGAVTLINLIPENIDFSYQWPIISRAITDFLTGFSNNFRLFTRLMYTLIGDVNGINLIHVLSWWTLLDVIILIGIIGLLVVINYLIARPLFFFMMSKSFEFDKKLFDSEEKNRVRKPFITFVNKELIINIRSVEISGNYIAVYIAVPILIMLLNNIFAAMNTKLSGEIMIYSFNLLLILLPLLASNSMIATLYSKEGRAGYMKKTKPINPLVPLISKLLFNLVLSLPSIVASMLIFARFANMFIGNALLMSLGVLLIQYGHIFFCATLDIMNPQNEQYATVGEEISNPNEIKATISAFILSAAFALFSYKLFNESIVSTGSFFISSLKLMFIGLAFFGSTLMMFILKVKAYYYER